MTFEIFLANEAATASFGAKLYQACRESQRVFIYLIGDLGAGKTTLVRNFIQAMGYSGSIKSPTYTLVEPYEFPGYTVYHFDLYRLTSPEELEYIGADDYFKQSNYCLIEWPERGVGILPAADITCYIRFQPDGRVLQIEAHSEIGQQIIGRL